MSILDSAKKVYMIGIKGVGMTALAQLLRAQGKIVWGSDVSEKFFTDAVLSRAGIAVTAGFAAGHLDGGIDLVISSAAYRDDNVEIKSARARGLPIITYAEALGELSARWRSVAVAGSHGKTTIAALLAYILQFAGLAPSAIVGSEVIQFNGNALVGSGDWLIFEADEYQNKFKYFSPDAVILTSIDWDHPDFFPTPDSYYQTFVDFLKKIPNDGFVVACYDDDKVRRAVATAGLKSEQIVTYGLTSGYWRMARMWLEQGQWHFAVREGETYHGAFQWNLIGSHNVANAIATIACARRLGVAMEKIIPAVSTFIGTRRRFELKGYLSNSAILLDDYAHHPTEIDATLRAARVFYPYKNIRVVFHPHTFSRTQALLNDFARVFNSADEVIVLDIYGSAREQGGDISTADLVAAIKKYHRRVEYRPTISAVAAYLTDTITRSDLIITMGAGDVWKAGEELIKKFGLMSGNGF